MQIPLATLSIAFVGGLAIALQGTLNSVAGRGLGAVATGLLVNAAGGLLSMLVLFALRGRLGMEGSSLRSLWPVVVGSGAIGIGIITAVAYAFPRTGLAAGLATIILGQMGFAVVIDALGWTGVSVAVDVRRIFGLLLLTAALWFLLPQPN